MSSKHSVTSHSLSGMNIDQLVHMCRPVCTGNPSLLIIHCGTNSLYPKNVPDTETRKAMTPEEVSAGLKSTLETLTAEFPNTKVIFSNLLVRDDHGEEGRDNIRKVNELVESLTLPVPGLFDTSMNQGGGRFCPPMKTYFYLFERLETWSVVITS